MARYGDEDGEESDQATPTEEGNGTRGNGFWSLRYTHALQGGVDDDASVNMFYQFVWSLVGGRQ